jgi:hypothetical protein
MDAGPAFKTTRKFPSYSVAQLKDAIAKYEAGTHPCGEAPAGHVDAMKAEIAAREAGTSTVFVVPQIIR